MRVLIVGGSGLISTGITAQLLARGDQVTWYNRGRRENLLAQQPPTILGDRTDLARFEAQMADAGHWDCVIDMVCYQPAEAESAVRAFAGRADHYVFCSTVDVYTKPAPRYPIVESCERQPRPSFPYAYSKAACERVLWAAHERGDLPVTAIRPAHTYGEGGRVLHSFGFETYILDRIRRGMPIVVHGDGRSLWSACHRDDVAGAFVGAAAQPGVSIGRAYHVAADEWLTWDRYYGALAEAVGVPCPPLVHIPSELLGRALPERALWCVENFSHINIFDTTAARRDLGFAYTIPVAEGFPRLVGWLQSHDQIEPASAYPFYDRLLAAWERLGTDLVGALAIDA
jgi:nucleoside-diphosphate-sugar epimerase